MGTYDEIITRLREEHQLDLSEVKTKTDLTKALWKTKSKEGITADSPLAPEHSKARMRNLISNALDNLYDVDEVQNSVVDNFRIDLDGAETKRELEIIRDRLEGDVLDRLEPEIDSKIREIEIREEESLEEFIDQKRAEFDELENVRDRKRLRRLENEIRESIYGDDRRAKILIRDIRGRIDILKAQESLEPEIEVLIDTGQYDEAESMIDKYMFSRVAERSLRRKLREAREEETE